MRWDRIRYLSWSFWNFQAFSQLSRHLNATIISAWLQSHLKKYDFLNKNLKKPKYKIDKN